MFVKKIIGRTALATALATLLVTPFLFNGCTQKITGDPFRNSPPTVRFVNTPPSGSVFSRNEVINWVGTDIDGQIVEFQYIVILEDDIPSGITVDDFAQSLPTNTTYDGRWTVIPVNLDDPGNSDRVAMSADFSSPATVVVSQYVFLYAIDNEGAPSRVVFRVYGRINHHPETRLEPFLSPYVNVNQQFQGIGGVPTIWDGSDELDFPGDDDPPLEFEWKLFGPFTQAESTLIIDDFTRLVYVTSERAYEIGEILYDTVFDFTQADTVIDTTVLAPDDTTFDTTISVVIQSTSEIPIDIAFKDTLAILKRNSHFDTVLSLNSIYLMDNAPNDTIPDPSTRLIESSFNPFTGDSWDSRENGVFLDIYRNDTPAPGADTTRELTFLFWVRARDDAFVPDPTPTFGMFTAIEARHERDLLVIDYAKIGPFNNVNGIWMPCPTTDTLLKMDADIGIDSSKAVFAEFVSDWRPGSVGKDNSFAFDTGSYDPCGVDTLLVPPGDPCDKKSLNPHKGSPDYMLVANMALSAINPFSASLRDVLKHKVVIIVKENVGSPLPARFKSPLETFLINGVLDGMSFWTMARGSFMPRGFAFLTPRDYGIQATQIPAIYGGLFGIRGGFFQAWYGMAVHRRFSGEETVRNEDFVGANPSEFVSPAEFPILSVDTSLLRRRILWSDTLACGEILLHHYPYLDTIGALPEVGFVVPITTIGAEAVYLYRSRFGEAKYPFFDLDIDNYQGTVAAVRWNQGQFRTSHWMFTPSALEEESFQIAFNSMMDWLFEPWGGTSNGLAPLIQPEAQTYPGPKLQKLARYLELQREKNLREIMPPGQRTVANQFEFNEYYKSWKQRKIMEERAEAAGFNY